MRNALLLSLLLAPVAACSAYDTDYGPTPFLCGPNEPRCPEGYSCQTDPGNGTEVCVENGGSVSGSFNCADDSTTEPNNDLAGANDSGVDGMKSVTIDGRSICPAGDKDTFAINIGTQNEDLELIVTFDMAGGALRAALLNTGGVPIQTATPNGSDTSIRAASQNLPTGVYYAQVYGPAGGDLQVNNYKLQINVTGP